jgi:hypothetical protein
MYTYCFFTVTKVTRKRLNVKFMRKLPVLIFGYVIQCLVDFFLIFCSFCNAVISKSDIVQSKCLMIVENKRKGREEPLGYFKVHNIWTCTW